MRHSQAAIRALAALPPRTPPVTVYPPDTPCHGLAFVRRSGDDLPDLGDLRGRVIGLRRGMIGAGGNAHEILVVLFDSEVKAPGLGHPSALPLVMDGGGVLASHGQPRSEPAARTSGSVRAVDIWWAGQAQRISLDLLDTLPVSVLWTMPDATVHAGLRPTVSARDKDARDPAQADQARLRPAEVAGNAGLAALASERGADPFAGMRESLGRKPRPGASLRIAMASLPAPGDLARYAPYGLLAIFLIGVLALGGAILPFVALFAVGRLIGGLVIGGEGETSGREVPTRPRGPGMIDNLLGWLAWKNPFGSLQRQVDARARQVKALAAKGMIDDALRLALRLGSNAGGRKLPHRYPRQLPSARARLDFDLAEAQFAMPVLSEQTGWDLRQTYEELAKRLEGKGDFSRAAFIRSQLLGQHEQAVHLLERGGMLDEAARLALAAKVHPALAIRLLYETGKHDAALALARRSGCFDKLVVQSRGKDARFHVLVLKAWTDALIASGQPLRALQVTDALASEPGADGVLHGLRRNWLGHAMRSVEAGFAAEPVARALLCGQIGDPGRLADFPGSLPRMGDALLEEALAALRTVMRDGEDGEELLALLGSLYRLSAPKAEEQAAFWNGAGPALIELLTGALLRQASHRLDPRDMDMLGQLLERAGHRVLAHDLGKLRKVYRAGSPIKRDWHVPEPATLASPVLAACVLGNGSILAWRESELLELLDAGGAVVWRQPVSSVSALVPVGNGANALILQAEPSGLTRITRFDCVRRSLHPVGAVALLAHHDVTSELGWLVQIDGNIGALDLAALCASVPRLEFLWSCSLTDRLRAVAFLHDDTAASWITIDVSPDRLGLTELWLLEGSGKLTTSICNVYGQASLADPRPPILWAWSAKSEHAYCQSLTVKDVHLTHSPWSEEAESHARQMLGKRNPPSEFDGFMPCDFGRSAVILAKPGGDAETELRTTIRVLDEKVPDFTLYHDTATALTLLARLPADPATRLTSGNKGPRWPCGKVLLADRFGRMFLVDPRLARVSLF